MLWASTVVRRSSHRATGRPVASYPAFCCPGTFCAVHVFGQAQHQLPGLMLPGQAANFLRRCLGAAAVDHRGEAN